MKKSLSDGEPIVLKIVPIEGHVLANGEPQKNYQEILPEIVISMELSNLRHGKEFMTSGFVNVKKVRNENFFVCFLFCNFIFFCKFKITATLYLICFEGNLRTRCLSITLAGSVGTIS